MVERCPGGGSEWEAISLGGEILGTGREGEILPLELVLSTQEVTWSWEGSVDKQ